MSDESALRRKAREAIQTGKLPNRGPVRMWGGPGVGAQCTICAKAIERSEVEFELQFAWDDAGGLGNYHVHLRCFAAWELERENAEAALSGCILPAAAEDGMIPARERDPQDKRGPA